MLGRAVVLMATVGLMGCPKLPPPQSAATVAPEQLPADVVSLLAYADEALKTDATVPLENALIAVDKALTMDPQSVEVMIRGARACAILAEGYPERGRRRWFADRGVDLAKQIERLAADRVEGHYFHGSNLGFVAATKTVGAVLALPEVVRAAKRAIEKNPRYDHAGPLRLLGTVLAKAPPWPASVGDVDEGIKYLRRAVELAPDYPLNHLFLADALLADEQTEQAVAAYQKMLTFAPQLEWERRIQKWHYDAQKALEALKR